MAAESVATLKERSVNTVAIATVLGAAAVGAALVAASSGAKSGTGHPQSDPTPGRGASASCPRVYSWNGATWRLDSGTYGGSYFKAEPRTDFDLLDHVAVENGKVRLRFVNEQHETEHTDFVRLRFIDHPQGTRVASAASGKIHTFRDEVRPMSARDFRGSDVRELVTTKDDREWSSDLRGRDARRADDARDGVRLVFAKPRDAKVAKIRVAAHNTEWAGEMLEYSLAQRGRTLPAWFSKMNTDARARAEFTTFLVREGMLNVRVKGPSGWSTHGVFWAAGPEIVKEEAFEIGVADISGERLEIELESALDFWSVDAVSIGYGNDEPIIVRDRTAAVARTSDGRDVTATLAQADGVLYDTVRGDVAELTFDAPPDPLPGAVRSIVLETRGYDVPEVTPAALANPGAMDALIASPFAASRLALAFRLAPAP